jgi:hypothetical protein
MQIRVRRGLDQDPIPLARDAEFFDPADGRVRLTFGRAERAEVVRAHQRGGGLRHAHRIERAVDPGRPLHGECRARGPIQNHVAIGARLRRVPRMEVHRHRAHPGNTDIGGQRAVGSHQPPAQRPGRARVEVRDLPAGMHARIGSSGADYRDGLGGDPAERRLDDLLDAGRGLLCLPARVPRTVVFNPDGEPHLSQGEIPSGAGLPASGSWSPRA